MWHTTLETQSLVREHRQRFEHDAEMYRLAKATREQQRQLQETKHEEPRSNRLVRALTRSHSPAK